MLYFAYASNLSKEYMLSRCPNATPIKKVMLKDYKLVFNELADIVEEVDKIVSGAIYVISKQELEELDRLEGYPLLYDRLVIEVEDDLGSRYDAFTYIMEEKAIQAPPEHYYQLLVSGYEDWELPMEHLEKAKLEV